MTEDPHPRNGLFVEYGRFKAGAFGTVGIIALVVLVAGLTYLLYMKP